MNIWHPWHLKISKSEGNCVWFLIKYLRKLCLKYWKKMWESFWSCLLNSTANPDQFGWKWAGLPVLFSRQLPNDSHNFFQIFSIIFKNYLTKNPQTTIALTFLTQSISAIGGVLLLFWGQSFAKMTVFCVS